MGCQITCQKNYMWIERFEIMDIGWGNTGVAQELRVNSENSRPVVCWNSSSPWKFSPQLCSSLLKCHGLCTKTPQLPVVFGSLLPIKKTPETTGSWGVLVYVSHFVIHKFCISLYHIWSIAKSVAESPLAFGTNTDSAPVEEIRSQLLEAVIVVSFWPGKLRRTFFKKSKKNLKGG